MSEMALANQTNKGDLASTESTRTNVTFTPRFDVFENDDELVLYGDLPGVGVDDLDVSYERGELRIHGKCKPRYQGTRCLAREYDQGDYYRAFVIQEPVDADKISAELHDGVLTVRLPKSELAKPKRISVKSS